MARLDVHPMPGTGRGGYVLDVQADLLYPLVTRAVVPLLPQDAAPKPISDLDPVFDIGGTRCVMVAQAIAGIPERELRRPVASLAEHHDRINRALDILLLGL